jgi:hypothetical protein
MDEPPGTYVAVAFNTAGRNKRVYSLTASRNFTPDAGRTDYYNVFPAVEWRPVSNFSVQVGPNLQRAIENAQYVPLDEAAAAAPGRVPADFGGLRYVFARMDQTTISADIRLNVSFSTNLTLQTYIQPLISVARYGDFKELARAGSYEFIHYGDGAVMSPDNVVTVTPAGGGDPFTFRNPDFNFKSLRGNAVLRWEYRPGSVLYVVWTQQRTDREPLGELQFGRSARRLVDAQADNIFLVKATYYLNL